MKRNNSRALITLLVAVSTLAAVAAPAHAAPSPAGSKPGDHVSASPPAEHPGHVGASVAFTEMQAEDAETNGTRIGPDRNYLTLAAEAVGRQAVRLAAQGEYVEFTLAEAANAVNVRYSIPDSADGLGLDATLGLYVNGEYSRAVDMTSRYSWYYGEYPWTNTPADGGAHHFYDDTRVMLDQTYAAGTKIRLQVGATDTAASYTIDVADFEKVKPAKDMPRDSLSVLDFGADPTGEADSTLAIQQAINAAAAAAKTLWIAEGTFLITDHLLVDDVTVQGAGPWHSVLQGDGVGIYGNPAPTPSSNVHLSDFAIFGEVDERVDADQLNGIGGALGESTIDNLWIQHTKVGVWVDGPFDSLDISNLRILDQAADGINFHDGITNSTVTNTFVRGTGDDGLAMWSGGHANVGNTFDHNTVESPVLANNIATYGGSDNTISNNLVTDTVVQGGGIHVANRFGAVPLAGTTTIRGNTLLRTGTLDLFWNIGEGALWFSAEDAAMDGRVDVSNNSILDSSYTAIQFHGKAITNVYFDYDVIDTTGTFAVQLNAPGAATFSHMTASGLGSTGRYDCDSGFIITEGPGNTGWADSQCGYPPAGTLTLSPSELDFSTGVVGESQTVTVTNTGAEAAPIASVEMRGNYTQSNTCGESLAAYASCTIDIVFSPTPNGEHNGALTVSDGTPAGRYVVLVSGEYVQPSDGTLSGGRTMTATSEVSGFGPGNANDSDPNTYWESTANAFPQALTIDLDTPALSSRAQLKLPGSWGDRTQRIEVLGSVDGSTFTQIVAPTDYLFARDADNVVQIAYDAAEYRYVQIVVTGNDGWPAGQVSEFQVFAE